MGTPGHVTSAQTRRARKNADISQCEWKMAAGLKCQRSNELFFSLLLLLLCSTSRASHQSSWCRPAPALHPVSRPDCREALEEEQNRSGLFSQPSSTQRDWRFFSFFFFKLRWECKLVQPLWRTVWNSPKTGNRTVSRPTIPLLSTYRAEWKNWRFLQDLLSSRKQRDQSLGGEGLIVWCL